MAGEGSKIHATYVPAGGIRSRRQHDIRLARTAIDIKVSVLDTGGGLCVTEVTSLYKGGPVRHLHHEQDEWFYVLEGEHVIEVGEERYELGQGIRSGRSRCWVGIPLRKISTQFNGYKHTSLSGETSDLRQVHRASIVSPLQSVGG